MRRRMGLLVGLLGAAVIASPAASDAPDDGPRNVYHVTTERLHGLIDATFGGAVAKAGDLGRQTGDQAFVLDSICGTASIDLSERKLVVRLDLLPGLSEDLLVARTPNTPANGIAEALRMAVPPLEERERTEAIADWLSRYHVPTVVGRPNDGGIPPMIYAISYAEPLPPLGGADLLSEWIVGKGDSLEAMLDDALRIGADAYSQGNSRIAYRLIAWTYESGGIAGLNEKGMVLEIRGLQDESSLPLPAAPEAAIETLRSLIAAHDWAALARRYDLSGGAYDPAELQSGAFFHRPLPPLDADAAGLWQYRHPFHPVAKLLQVDETDDPSILKATMVVEIDQGGGTPQRMLSAFKLRKVEGGLLALPE